jgi:hypothetical protein
MWIVLLAVTFWAAAWKHEFVMDMLHKAWKGVSSALAH